MRAAENSNAGTYQKLAINGGTPVRTSSFPSWPSYSDAEIEAATNVLQSGRVNYWTGDQCQQFEKEFAAFCGVNYAVAVANGTAALEIALRAIGVGAGDEVVVPARTFVATAGSVIACGATPVFASVDQLSQNINADTISAVLTPRTKAIITVHLAGWPCEMDEVSELAKLNNLRIVEDCAQAHGAEYKGRTVGSLGDVAAFSFCQDKIISTGGEGGMVTANDADIWRRAWSFKDHGRNYERSYAKRSGYGYLAIYETFGVNLRMTEFQASIGRVQLGNIGQTLAKRRQNAGILNDCFGRLPALRVTLPDRHIAHAYYKYYVFLRPEALMDGWSQRRILEAINAEGVPASQGVCPELYQEKVFEGICQDMRSYPELRALGETSIMMLVHPTATDKDMRDYCDAVTKVLAVASR